MNTRVTQSRYQRRFFDDQEVLLFPELSDNPWTTRSKANRGHDAPPRSGLSALELCAGAGGQALGYEQAGIAHNGLVEINPHACATLRANRPDWNVLETDLNHFNGAPFVGTEILCGGLPCPPFSVAGKQLGKDDERNLFPVLIRLVHQIKPQAVMIENVRGILDAVFEDYRTHIGGELKKLGYVTGWKLMNASDFGVPQLRPRVVFVALRSTYSAHFDWPRPADTPPKTVGETLFHLMREGGWKGAEGWRSRADEIAPTLVGGSHKHGGPDLGPTRARRAWAALGVDGCGIANEPPPADFVGMPKLTVQMTALLQGFPDSWRFTGKKTNAYRQVGNAFPPPFAKAIAGSVREALLAGRRGKAAG